jgi:alkylation response protein AidB-like acyl-CoA dehydrogenase
VDLRLSGSELAFRGRLREWLAWTLPPKPERDNWPACRVYDTYGQRLLYNAGYAGVDWPAKHGGPGASPTEQLIFPEEVR